MQWGRSSPGAHVGTAVLNVNKLESASHEQIPTGLGTLNAKSAAQTIMKLPLSDRVWWSRPKNKFEAAVGVLTGLTGVACQNAAVTQATGLQHKQQLGQQALKLVDGTALDCCAFEPALNQAPSHGLQPPYSISPHLRQL